jgi:nickel-dependent lactate racemase
MKIDLGYGKSNITIDIDSANLLSVLKPNKIQVSSTGEEEVKRAIKEPIGSVRLKEIVKPEDKIAIITSDITRPMPTKVVLPIILTELFDAGVKLENITIVFSLGSHRRHSDNEKRKLVGNVVYKKIKCIDSDPTDIIHLGISSRGTPIDIFSLVVEADIRICLGNIEYHYFAGYSGGAKAIMPGVSTREAIQANHSMMVEDGAMAGRLETNPVREDIDEVGKFISIDFILNVILDEHKKIIKAVAGHYIYAHREGCSFLDSIYKVYIPEQADIVIVSPGGYPKDINLYQAQKALDNAAHAVKPGGIVILVASCKEGLGDQVFEKWMLNALSPENMVTEIHRSFELGGHKAAAIAMTLRKARIFLVSEMEKNFVRRIFLEPFLSVDEALKQAFNILGEKAKVIFMPFGSSTLPVLEEYVKMS